MKFKRVNENKIIIMISTAELESRNIDLWNLRNDPIAYQKLFWDMMEKAQAELGFDVSGSQLMVETAPDKNGNVTITITKSGANRNSPNVVEKIISEIIGNIQEELAPPNSLLGMHMASLRKSGNAGGNEALGNIMGNAPNTEIWGSIFDNEPDFENEIIYFNKIDDVIDFCKSIKGTRSIASVLYNFNEKYYLCLKRTKQNGRTVSNLLDAAAEFNGYINESYLLRSMLEERGNKIIKAKAIKTLAENF